MLSITKIESFEELLKLEDDWNELLDKSQTKTVFSTFEWITNWWQCFGNDKKLWVLLVKEHNKIIGIAPLMITNTKRFGLNLNKIEFIGMPLSDYTDFIISEKDEEVLQKIFEFVIDNKKTWSYIKLNHIPEASSTLAISKKVLKSKLCRILLSSKCPTFVFDDTWEDYKKQLNSRKMRRKINYFNNRGELSLSRCDGNTQETIRLLNIFFEQHQRRWNHTGTPSMFNDDLNKKFFVNLTASLLKKDMVEVFHLKFDQKPIAFDYAYFYGNTCLAYMSSYDTDFSKRSPGIILNKFVLEYCANKKFRELDYLRGNEKYKLKYANQIKKNFVISIHRNILLYLLDYLSNKIENVIKENQKLYNFFIKYEKKLRIF